MWEYRINPDTCVYLPSFSVLGNTVFICLAISLMFCHSDGVMVNMLELLYRTLVGWELTLIFWIHVALISEIVRRINNNELPTNL